MRIIGVAALLPAKGHLLAINSAAGFPNNPSRKGRRGCFLYLRGAAFFRHHAVFRPVFLARAQPRAEFNPHKMAESCGARGILSPSLACY